MRISDWSSDVCSSDLHPGRATHCGHCGAWSAPPRVSPGRHPHPDCPHRAFLAQTLPSREERFPHARQDRARGGCRHWLRSEEHPSELQSLMRISYAVFCLKKKKHTEHNTTKKH